nr:immunoglobulin heavy chain junction region [Mus musculus]
CAKGDFYYGNYW